ncbi:MAG: hypothetical protein ACTSRU_13955 [Candidatus Hodarchaeales archaeon]
MKISKQLEIIKKRIFGRKKLILQSTKHDLRGNVLSLAEADNSISALVSFGPLSRMSNYKQGLREYARVMKKSASGAIAVWVKRHFDFKGTQYYLPEKRFKSELEKFFTVKSETILVSKKERKFIVYEVRKK